MKKLFILCIGLAALYGCGDSSTGPRNNNRIDLTVYVMEEDGTAVQRASVSTIPPTSVITTDDRGSGTFVNILRQPYFFVIVPQGRPTYQYYLTLENASPDSLQLKIITEPPRVDIIFPRTNNIVSTEAAVFSGAAIDHEDGPIPDSLLVWLNNGVETGRGKEIEMIGLTMGNHVITLIAYDSDGKFSSSSITVNAKNYSVSSYFPIVNGGEWQYNQTPYQFSMYNHQQILERWSLDNVNVTFDMGGRRISTMTYRATALSKTRFYRYQVVDYIREFGNNISITGTTEEMRIWWNSTDGQPDEYLLIETNYDPDFTLMSNKLDPRDGGEQIYSGTAEVKWTYIGIGHGTTSFIENPSIDMAISAGMAETIVIGGKNIETVPVTLTDGSSQRRWWLSPGLGIVRFQYNTFNVNPVATLSGTNVATDYNAPLFMKTVVESFNNEPVVEAIPETEFDHLRMVREIMRSAAP